MGMLSFSSRAKDLALHIGTGVTELVSTVNELCFSPTGCKVDTRYHSVLLAPLA